LILECLLAALAAPVQDPPREPTIVERLDALIAKSNEYQHFVATYHFEDKRGEAGELRILYRAPDQAKFVVTGDTFRLCICIHGDTLDVRSRSGEATASTATVDSGSFQRSEAVWLQGALEAAFPKMVPRAELEIADGLSFGSEGGKDCESYGLELSKGGQTRLNWLAQMGRHLDRVSTSDVQVPLIIFRPCEDLRVSVSPDSGFITRMERDRKDGVHVGLSLVSLELEEAPSDDDLRPPAPETGALDVSDAYLLAATRTAFAWGRSSLYRVVSNAVTVGRLEWNDEARVKVTEVMRAVHASEFPVFFEYFVTPENRWIDETAEWAHAYLAEFEPGDKDAQDQLSPLIAKCRTEFEGRCTGVCEQMMEFAFPEDQAWSKPPSAMFEDLVALERRVLPEVFTEVITKPLLAEFDEKVAKQLDAK
jgi:hypothetical protein